MFKHKDAKTRLYKTKEVESSILLKNKIKPPLPGGSCLGRDSITSITVMFPNLLKYKN